MFTLSTWPSQAVCLKDTKHTLMLVGKQHICSKIFFLRKCSICFPVFQICKMFSFWVTKKLNFDSKSQKRTKNQTKNNNNKNLNVSYYLFRKCQHFNLFAERPYLSSNISSNVHSSLSKQSSCLNSRGQYF